MPLIWARKLSSRFHDYFYESHIAEFKSPKHYEDGDSHKVRQRKTLAAVRKDLHLDEASGTPTDHQWKGYLADKMFYI